MRFKKSQLFYYNEIWGYSGRSGVYGVDSVYKRANPFGPCSVSSVGQAVTVQTREESVLPHVATNCLLTKRVSLSHLYPRGDLNYLNMSVLHHQNTIRAHDTGQFSDYLRCHWHGFEAITVQ